MHLCDKHSMYIHNTTWEILLTTQQVAYWHCPYSTPKMLAACILPSNVAGLQLCITAITTFWFLFVAEEKSKQC